VPQLCVYDTFLGRYFLLSVVLLRKNDLCFRHAYSILSVDMTRVQCSIISEKIDSNLAYVNFQYYAARYHWFYFTPLVVFSGLMLHTMYTNSCFYFLVEFSLSKL